MEDDSISDNSEEDTIDKDNKNNIKNNVKSRRISIDGIFHSLHQTSSTKRKLDDGTFIVRQS